MISIRHIRKEFSNVIPLKDINAEINKGDIISIIGPSGTGKSTLLRCMNLLETPTSGEVFLDGELITQKNVHLMRRKMGMVFQTFNLFSHLTVIENIMETPVAVLGKSRQEAYDFGMKLLSSVGLAAQAYQYPDELSGGQKQRAAIARTLAMEPEIILFDEPTSALDPTMIGEVLSVIRNLAKQGLTMIIVTHEMKFARDVSTRVFYIDQGEIYEEGTPEQIFDNPQKELTRRFINRLKVFDESSTVKMIDLPALNTKLEEFGRKYLMSQKSIYKMQLIFEELFINEIMPKLDSNSEIRLVVEHAEENSETKIELYYNGKFNPLVTGDELSIKLVKGFSTELNYIENSSEAYTDCVKIKLK